MSAPPDTASVAIPSWEWRRKAVHAGMGLFALAFKWLDWRGAAALAAGALLFNLFVMPRIGRGIYRDAARARDPGIVSYAAMVLLLILLFRDHLEIAAAVWAMMALGDPAAAISGKTLGGPRLPWNPEKRWTGFFAAWAAGAVAALVVLRFLGTQLPPDRLTAVCLAGAGVYAFLESVRSGLDDNLVAALPTALVVSRLAEHAPPPFWALADPSRPSVALALVVNAAVALATWRLGIVKGSGAAAGAVAGAVILIFGGWPAYALLWAFFLAGTAVTKLGYRRKAAARLAQAEGGRRGAAHVVANCAVPAALAVLGVHPVALAAAFAAALADTVATEVGTLYGRSARSPLTGRSVPPGTSGAVSLPGTAASLLAAALFGGICLLVGLPPLHAGIAAVAGFLGALAESVAKDLSRRAGAPLDHEFANAFNTFAGAVIALGLIPLLGGPPR